MSDDPFATLPAEGAPQKAADIATAAEIDSVVIRPVPDRAPEPTLAVSRLYGRAPDRIYTYRDRDGRALFHVCRWSGTGGNKEIRPLAWVRHRDGSEDWAFRNHPAPRPLYGLEHIAQRPHASVVVVEGEKATEAAAKIFPDSVVVTWPGGSNAVSRTDWSPLRGASEVVVWPDADLPGMKAAHAVVEALADYEGTLTVVDGEALAALSPADGGRRVVTPGWDAADAVDEWTDLDALRSAVERHSRQIEAGGPKYRSFGRFEMSDLGLYAALAKGKGKDQGDEKVRIASAFEVVGRVRDSEGYGWSKLLRWKDEDGRTRTHAVADADLHGDPRTICSTLAGMGLDITRGCGGPLADYLNAVHVDPASPPLSARAGTRLPDPHVLCSLIAPLAHPRGKR